MGKEGKTGGVGKEGKTDGLKDGGREREKEDLWEGNDG